MALELVLNELSAGAAADLLQGRERIETFVRLVGECAAAGFPKVLRVTRNFFQELLAPNYPIARWMSDRAVDRDTRVPLQTWSTKAPYIEDLLENELRNSADITEFMLGRTAVLGFAVAYLLDTLAVSFASHERWNRSRVELLIRELDENGDISEEAVEVRHASTCPHVENHRAWIGARRREDVIDGPDLWARRGILFERLDFCPSVGSQLSPMAARNPELGLVVRAFFDLQDYCSDWTEGGFDASSLLRVSIESEATIKKYGTEREFVCPDGEKRLFSWHLKRGAMRIYFIPNPELRRILVGHVGLHLRTVRYPN